MLNLVFIGQYSDMSSRVFQTVPDLSDPVDEKHKRKRSHKERPKSELGEKNEVTARNLKFARNQNFATSKNLT